MNYEEFQLHLIDVASKLNINAGHIDASLMPILVQSILTQAFLKGYTRNNELVKIVVYQYEFLQKSGHWDLKG